jgi:hypothetical protein
MLNRLTIAVVAGAFAFASAPAFALDLPDSGSKNFSPAGDTPTYFANESVPVSARTADTSASDWTAEEAAAPVTSVVRPIDAARPRTGWHGRHGSIQRSARYSVGKSTGHGRSTRFASTSAVKPVATGSARHAAAPTRMAERPVSMASVRSPSRAAASAAKASTARHAKAGSRHAAFAVTPPASAVTGLYDQV